MGDAAWNGSSSSWQRLAGDYAQLERDVRAVIDRVAGRVCPGCTRLCCRVHYCRETLRNPWYCYVSEVAGTFSPPADARTRRDPFGLGAAGCEIRAGRYVFCYSYNCPAILRHVEQRGVAAEFQQISDLLRDVNRLPGGRLLHELEHWGDLGRDDHTHLQRAVVAAGQRLRELARVFG